MSKIANLKKLQLNIGSFRLSWDPVGQKKVMNFEQKMGWDSPYNAKLNAVFFKTGEINNIAILDLDDMDSEVCRKLQKLAENCCNTVVKSRKGYHYYFPFENEFAKKRNMKKYNFDYLSNDAVIIAPPTTYKMGDQIIEYKFVQFPDNGKMSPMNDELKLYLKELFSEKPSQKQQKVLDKFTVTEVKKTAKQNITYPKFTDAEIKELLTSLDVRRADEYIYWITAGLALKAAGYDWPLWDEFSQRSSKYESGQPFYQWQYHLKPNNVTIGTLLYWLKEDSPEVFKKLMKTTKLKDYDNTIDLTNETDFNDARMQKLFDDDIDQLGTDGYTENFENTRSFKYFNHFHMHLVSGDQFYKVGPSGQKWLKFSDKKFDSAYGHYHTVGLVFTKLWRISKGRQRYDDFEFSPIKPVPKQTYNLFQGFRFDDTTKEPDLEKIKPILEHIKYIMVKDEYYNYVLDWGAFIRQKPYRKTEVAIVLYSHMKGSGKTSIYKIFEPVFKGYESFIYEKDLEARFNNVLFQSKLLVGCDEIKGMGKHDAERLKNLITQTKINIEAKGDDIYKVNDLANYIFSTNNSIALKIEDDDRRFAIFNTVEDKRERSYYDKLYELLEDESVVAEFNQFLLKRDISKFHPKDSMPMTDYKKENVLFNLPVYIQMIRNSPQDFAGNKYSAQELIRLSREYSQKNRGYSQQFTEKKAERDLSKYLASFKKRDSTNRYFEFGIDVADCIDNEIMSTL